MVAVARLTPRSRQSYSLADYADQWVLLHTAMGGRSERTYRSRLVNHILPHLGSKRLRAIRRKDLVRWIETLRAEGLAPRTVRHNYALVRAILSHAAAHDLVDITPASLTKHELPKNIDADPSYNALAVFTAEELATLLSDASQPYPLELSHPVGSLYYRSVLHTLALTGLRIGELQALHWSDVEFDTTPLGRITARATWDAIEHIERPPKTGIAREIPIHPALAPVLELWRDVLFPQIFGHAPLPADRLFPAIRGYGIQSAEIALIAPDLRRALRAQCARLGLRHTRRRLHHFRHSFISHAANADGANVEILRLLTHARPSDVRAGYHKVPFAAKCRELVKWSPLL